LFSDLVNQGELRRVRKGLYWRGVKTPLGMSPPPVDELVAELAPIPGTGPAGLSAANVLHLSTQVPRRSQVAVPARPPGDLGAVSFVSRAARTGRRTAKLRPLEVALLEMLDGWEMLLEVSPAEGWKTLGALVASGAVRPESLARAAKTEPAPVRARLSELLKEVGATVAAAAVPEVDARTLKSALTGVPVAP
jgi:hypothetical protein